MAKERTKDDVEWELEWEKKQKKFILICSAVCAGIGLIIGIIMAIRDGEPVYVFTGFWIGTGAGNIISYIPAVPHVFKRSVKAGGGCFGKGCIDSVIDLVIGILIWMVIFAVLGPIGTLIRFLLNKRNIRKLEEELSEFK